MPTLSEIQRKLLELKARGYVPSLRSGPTGIGYTLEQHLGLAESNVQIPDLGGRIELKATRRGSYSLITLFTFNRGAWRMPQEDVVETYGYASYKPGKIKELYSTVWIGQQNSQGFTLEVDEASNRLKLLNGTNEVAVWSIYRIVGTFYTKLRNILYVIADARTVDEAEEFHYNEAYLLANPDEEKFIEAFKELKACIDIRMHLKENGRVRNHGTGFRVRENILPSLFAEKKPLV